MRLRYFTEEAYDKLLSDIPGNAEKYSEENDWLPEYFGSENDYYKISSVEVSEFEPLYIPGRKDDAQKSREDLENTKRLHRAFINLTPYQASIKYMWTYLCHAIPAYRNYIRDRWMQDERENTIRNRFFVTDYTSLLNDNALSRLWWFGHLTYDPHRENPYELTEILLANQTICTDVMDTSNRMNPDRIRGILMAIKDFKNEIPNGEGITEYFRECKKYLNHYAAVTILESLTPEEIRDLAYKYMVNLRDEKTARNGGPKSRRKRQYY